MVMESEMERSLRGGLMEFSPKEGCSVMMADQQGDSSSAEDTESPRSPAARIGFGGRRRRWRKVAEDRSKERCYMHSQILRIKEEESQIGADFFGDYCCDGFLANSHPLDDRFVIWARSILPASPLSGKKIGRSD